MAERAHDTRDRTERDLERIRRREPASRFFRSLALIGSVGWPIVAFALGGALLGRLLDERLHAGVRFTLMLLTLGTAAGTAIAFRTVRRHP